MLSKIKIWVLKSVILASGEIVECRLQPQLKLANIYFVFVIFMASVVGEFNLNMAHLWNDTDMGKP